MNWMVLRLILSSKNVNLFRSSWSGKHKHFHRTHTTIAYDKYTNLVTHTHTPAPEKVFLRSTAWSEQKIAKLLAANDDSFRVYAAAELNWILFFSGKRPTTSPKFFFFLSFANIGSFTGWHVRLFEFSNKRAFRAVAAVWHRSGADKSDLLGINSMSVGVGF